LGVAKKTIYVVATQNDEAIVAKRRSLITLEDFQNVHAIIIHQLAMAEEFLKTTLRSKAFSNNGLLKDLKNLYVKCMIMHMFSFKMMCLFRE
jgi:hypothetical protein